MTYSKDTRTLQVGDIYVAIRGERHDGHAFVRDAIALGAAGAIVEKPVDTSGARDGFIVTQVDDSVRYLAEAARSKVDACKPDMVAITGSIGKTSTRNAIATVLGRKFSVVASTGNLNTLLGLSLTVLNADFGSDTKLVLEMGACKRGDIAELCAYFRPSIAVVTNVHGVHLETFGTIDDVARTKGELVQGLRPRGAACLNHDDVRVRVMASLHDGPTVFYGRTEGSDVGPDVITEPLPLLGAHAVSNCLAAVAVGRMLGMRAADINAGLSRLTPEKGRMHRLPGRRESVLIDDSYNASPASTASALAVLGEQRASRRVAYLGDMLELGKDEIAAHIRIIRLALEQADVIVLVGDRMAAAAGAISRAERQPLLCFPTSTDVVVALDADAKVQPRPGDVALVKGSQGVRMERISRKLLSEEIAPETVLPRQTESWWQI